MSGGLSLPEGEARPTIADIFIVTAGLEDLADLVPLFDAYRAFFAGSHDAAESKRFLAERLGCKDSVVFLARSGERAEGFIQLYPLWSSWYCRRIWFLSDLYVRELSRKRGLGRRLVESALAHARATNASSVMVELPHREPHLRAFYAGLGFHQDEVFDLARYRLET
jgi:GNAT superfamily N-acetyltransferase